MSNIQKAFKNKAKCGLRMATGGFLDTVQDAAPTSMFSGPGGGVGTTYASPGSGGLRANQRNAGFSSGAGFTPGRLQQPVQPTSVGNALDNRIGMGTAIENSNLTMSEKGALGLGTTSADASALRRQTDALTTLRSTMPQQQLAMQQPEQEPFALAESGVVAAQAQADRMCKEYKVGCDTVRPPAAPVQQAAPAPVAKPQGIIGLLKGRSAQIDAASGYAKSGVVQGEGTRTSDSVPAVVGEGDEKQKLALSKGEGLLVVSNNTMDNPQAMDQIRQILADSNGGKEPKMPDQGLRAGVQKAAASGFFPAQQGYMAQVEAGKREVAGPPAPSARVLQPDEAAALKEKVLTGEVVGSMNRDDKSPQEISQGSVGNTFVADGIKPGLRSGAVSNMQPDPNVKYGTTMVDATEMQAPNGGGYITGAPMHANGLRRAIEVAPSAPTARGPNGEYDVHGNNMAYTNQMKKQLAEMQKDRIERTAAMSGATRGDMVALATQMRNDQLASVNARTASDAANHGAELGLRKQALYQQGELALMQQQALQQQKNKEEMDSRLEHANKLIKDSGVDEKELPAFIRYANEVHVGGERQEDGSFKPKDNFETLTKAQQQKMIPGILAGYETMKRAYKHRVNRGSVGAFVAKPDSELKPGEGKFQVKDIDTYSNGFWKPWGDNPTENGVAEYLNMKLMPGWLGGMSDDMVVGTNGMRVRRAEMDGEILDKNGFPIRGSADVKGLRRKQQQAGNS